MKSLFFKKSKIVALIAAVAVAATSFGVYHSFAAGKIEQETSKVTINVDEATVEDIAKSQGTISGHLYKIGEVSQTGQFSSEAIDIDAYTKLAGSEEAKADEIAEFVDTAKAYVENNQVSGIDVELTDGSDSADVDNGIYLVSIDDVMSLTKVYQFTSFIIAAPQNNYFSEGATDDAWNYDIVANAKVGTKDRLGDLVIQKDLERFYKVLSADGKAQPTTAIFKIVVMDGETKVYDDVQAVDFNGIGTNSIVIENLPAGSTYTVSEVYAGGSYKVDGESTYTGTIVAGDKVEDEDTVISASRVDGAVNVENAELVEFKNDYSGTYNTGSISVTNEFKLEGENYKWTKIKGGAN